MKLARGFTNPYNYNNLHVGSYTTMISSQSRKVSSCNDKSSLKITCAWNSKPNNNNNNNNNNTKSNKLRKNWKEFQGINNWEGLLDPLDESLRDEILRYGGFVEAAYRCFDFDVTSSTYATCRHPIGSMLSVCGLASTGYRVTKYLHATCGAHLPDWARDRVPSWASARSGWIGYVAVCDDQDEISRLGRRDVVVAYRGTATCMEWVENLRAALTCLSDEPGPMVQSGFLSLYTSRNGPFPSLQDSIREEINRILKTYKDEPLSITITGHSLGAALATLTAHDVKAQFKDGTLVTVVSFGGPRVGNEEFGRQLEENGTKVLRIVNADDPVTRVPGFVLDEAAARAAMSGFTRWLVRRVEDVPQWAYAEIGRELRLSSKDCPHTSGGNVATCHDLKTYLHLVESFVSSNCPLRATTRRVLIGRSVLEGEKQQHQVQQQQILCK